MMLGARTAAWSGKRLPYDAEVEYLQSKPVSNETTMPTTFINTGIKCNTPLSVDVDFSLLEKNPNSMFFGSRSSINGRFQLSTGGGDNSNFVFLGYLNIFNTKYAPVIGIRNSYNVSFDASYSFSVDGDVKFSGTGSEFSTGLDMWMFACNAFNGVYGGNSATQIYKFVVRVGSELKFDAIPVRFTNDNGDDEGAMYDRVSGKIFRNQGSGAFVIGPDKT